MVGVPMPEPESFSCSDPKVPDAQTRNSEAIKHSHVSPLINMGFTALAIADRMGHEAADITYRYAHLFPSVQANMAHALDGAGKES